MDKNVSLDLMDFIETEILPRYSRFDKAHNITHVTRVINRAVKLARTVGADINMAYTAAAYHDLGLEGPRAIHHLGSGKIVDADARLKRWFSAEQINIIKEAVEDTEPLLLTRRGASTAGLWQRPTATWSLKQCSDAPYCSDLNTTPTRARRSNGSDLCSILKTNIRQTVTFGFGFQALTMKRT